MNIWWRYAGRHVRSVKGGSTRAAAKSNHSTTAVGQLKASARSGGRVSRSPPTGNKRNKKKNKNDIKNRTTTTTVYMCWLWRYGWKTIDQMKATTHFLVLSRLVEWGWLSAPKLWRTLGRTQHIMTAGGNEDEPKKVERWYWLWKDVTRRWQKRTDFREWLRSEQWAYWRPQLVVSEWGGHLLLPSSSPPSPDSQTAITALPQQI